MSPISISIKEYPDIAFVSGVGFVWNPDTSTVTYPKDAEINGVFIASLAHEIGHAKCAHQQFRNDVELLKIEREAWVKGSEIAQTVFGLTIPESHVERCLDTYRDWLYTRATCPTCKQCGIQILPTKYHCVFCNTKWSVNKSRLCKVTKKRQTTPKTP
jgi:hypothetical protein